MCHISKIIIMSDHMKKEDIAEVSTGDRTGKARQKHHVANMALGARARTRQLAPVHRQQ